MNLPNKLTISRVVLTIIFIILMRDATLNARIAAGLVFLLASLTDFLDGFLAKKNAQVSDFGKIMDPIADKFLMLSAFFIFARLHLFPVWIFWVIFVREVAVTIIRLYAIRKGKVLAAEGLGKVKTVSQIIAVYTMIVYVILSALPQTQQWPAGVFSTSIVYVRVLMYVVVILTVASGLTFLNNNRQFYRV